MATQIIAVRTEQPFGQDHPHISQVKTADGRILDRATVVSYIRNGWEAFEVTSRYGQSARVIVVSCPYCYASDYIRTVADSTTTDNLLSLPRF